jgi:hypothetical protein
MPAVRLYAFSVGHVLNDMTAACWFSYLLIYLTQVSEGWRWSQRACMHYT